MIMKKLEDKIVWITGASSGIGQALARQLNALGCTVVLSSRNQTLLEVVQNNLPNPYKSIRSQVLEPTSHNPSARTSASGPNS